MRSRQRRRRLCHCPFFGFGDPFPPRPLDEPQVLREPDSPNTDTSSETIRGVPVLTLLRPADSRMGCSVSFFSFVDRSGGIWSSSCRARNSFSYSVEQVRPASTSEGWGTPPAQDIPLSPYARANLLDQTQLEQLGQTASRPARPVWPQQVGASVSAGHVLEVL